MSRDGRARLARYHAAEEGRDAMERTPEVEQVLHIVRQVVAQHFRDHDWIFLGAPLVDAIVAAVDEAGPAEP